MLQKLTGNITHMSYIHIRTELVKNESLKVFSRPPSCQTIETDTHRT